MEIKINKLYLQEQVSSTLASRYDQLVQEFESAKKMLMGFDEENAQLSDQLRVNERH